ncbi:MAG: glycosyltransferase [Solirubrobacterales bacterium]
MPADSSRPTVSVVVPFAGDPPAAARTAGELRGLSTRPGDELIVVDNSPRPAFVDADGIELVRAAELASSYYARNRGAERASGDWLLFVDSDCLLPPTLIDDYFSEPPGERCGIVAGGIVGEPSQDSVIAGYARSRGQLAAGPPLELGPTPAVGTANALVRRAVWAELGGFAEVVSGADFEFSWRAGEAGWRVESRPAARVSHLHPETLAELRAKARRYGAGQRWANERFPGANPPRGVARELARSAAGMIVWGLRGQVERARFKALDGIVMAEFARGYRFGQNAATAPET